jgi:hypothetical protein
MDCDLDELIKRFRILDSQVGYLSKGLLPFGELEQLLKTYPNDCFKDMTYEKDGFFIYFHIDNWHQPHIDFDGGTYVLNGRIRNKLYENVNM